jgi:hypothetical protein
MRSLRVVVLLTFGAAACGGAIDPSSSKKQSEPPAGPMSNGANTPPATGVGGASPAAHCAGALRLELGGTVQGSTCGGKSVGESPCQEPQHPDVFVYVDAPDGMPLALTASPGVSLLAFSTCESDQTFECSFQSPTFDPSDVRVRLFGVERVDTYCGDFTVGAH